MGDLGASSLQLFGHGPPLPHGVGAYVTQSCCCSKFCFINEISINMSLSIVMHAMCRISSFNLCMSLTQDETTSFFHRCMFHASRSRPYFASNIT